MSKLRLSPSGPVVGFISAMPLRVSEDMTTLGAPLVLTGAEQDVSAALRVELSGPFEPGHEFSAECELDVSNASTNVLGTVTLALQLSVDGGAWSEVATGDFNVGANGAAGLRQIRPINLHALPELAADFGGGIPAGAATVALRVVASAAAGEATLVHVEPSACWLRITEHSAA